MENPDLTHLSRLHRPTALGSRRGNMVRNARPIIVTIGGARMVAPAYPNRQGSSPEEARRVASIACFPSVAPTVLRLVASTTWQRGAASTTWQSPKASTTWQSPKASTTWQSPKASTTWQRGVERRSAA
jgi:hypothetical protein